MTERRPHLPGQAVLEAYGDGGFRFAGLSHRGGLMSLPSGMYAWEMPAGRGFVEADFADLFLETSPVDLCLIGTGLEMRPLPEALRWRFRERRIQVDTMQTGHAVRTYNILLAENRRVAAALIAVD